MIVSVEYLSKFFRKDVRTIQNWANDWLKKGVDVRKERGEYDFEKCCNMRIQDLEEQLDQVRRDKPQDTLALKNAELKDLMLQEKLKNLVDANQVSDMFSEAISIIISNIDGMPIRLAPQLISRGNIKEILKILEDNFNKLKETIAKTGTELHGNITEQS